MGAGIATACLLAGMNVVLIEMSEDAATAAKERIAGNLRDVFASLTPASDLHYDYDTNAPTVRVEGLTIAGR